MNDKIRILVAEDHLVARWGEYDRQHAARYDGVAEASNGSKRRVVPEAPARCDAAGLAQPGMEEWKRPRRSGEFPTARMIG